MTYTWSDDKPKEPGWYWLKEMSGKGVVLGVSVVRLNWEPVYGRDNEYGGYLYDSETNLRLDELVGQWAGPIPEPEEPRS